MGSNFTSLFLWVTVNCLSSVPMIKINIYQLFTVIFPSARIYSQDLKTFISNFVMTLIMRSITLIITALSDIILWLARITISIIALVYSVFTYSLSRKLFVIFIFIVLVALIFPLMIHSFAKVIDDYIVNPRLLSYNSCVLNVLETIRVDEEFSWYLKACGSSPPHYIWQ